MFRIKDIDFNIKFAYLSAYISDEIICFDLKIRGEQKENIFLGYEPNFETNNLLNIKSNKIKKWQEITGKVIEWNEHTEDECENPWALLYIFEHEAVYNTKIEFMSENDKIFVKIGALCNRLVRQPIIYSVFQN